MAMRNYEIYSLAEVKIAGEIISSEYYRKN